ncbi:aminomethyl-transferring glycine dehydrogenase [uncultured Kocuria sp.]|uniref:aminomethyl-transferring glycine dehydrogenase n=1 Tax=uncultured Kocuria sp. TaxID=259305 RepID=UPI002592F423|nr:aminomethyl-transferring glycine dehydrogenase [uncultured Kocuria sp.]MCT1367337.1 aminomethyl-transferring glycine dehydrogenase [Rothia sp. p3-SID1597]
MSFIDRHLGPRPSDIASMLNELGYDSLASLSDAAVPASIRRSESMTLPGLSQPLSEDEATRRLRGLADRNQVKVQMIGQGYSETITPAVLRRNILESPGWYTSYTPYQPEISQGRLEALLNFQNAIMDLTGMDIANASMLDEATSAAEAVVMMRRANRKVKGGAVAVDARLLPQTLRIVEGRLTALGIEHRIVDLSEGLPDDELFGVIAAQIGSEGQVIDNTELASQAHERNALVTIATDPLALTLISSPGAQGADIAVGSSQRFGVPLFFGGPHAAFIAVRRGFERSLPGRLVGVSTDAAGRPAYRLSLQTREQHIRREKATSNICTAQALLAIVAGAYAVYHGPEGLRRIAEEIHDKAAYLAAGLNAAGIELAHETFFDTVTAVTQGRADEVMAAALAKGINLRKIDNDRVGISIGEPHTFAQLDDVLSAFDAAPSDSPGAYDLPEEVLRQDDYLRHPVFHAHRSETQMMRYLRELSDKDLALDRTMIPLGSCTMKLNSAAEMEPISWPEFASIHPLAPRDQAEGWLELIQNLEDWLTAVTGYSDVSLQPNAGSQGEYAGLQAIRDYHRDRGESERDVVLIPASAHGTNAASAVMAGLRVVSVATAEDGSINIEDLTAKIEKYGAQLAAIMITYPSTHGVYEETVTEVCRLVHEAGGQVYVDGANLNALMGLAAPGEFGGDVSHLNLHKTFCIPHGGGGPGVGPVAVASQLAPYLPGDAAEIDADSGADSRRVEAVSQAFFGSAGVLPISWMYIAMTGAEGLRASSEVAILNANYLAKRLNDYFPVLYTGPSGLVAHECIIDVRDLSQASGITAEDVCKRLIDYGFHAPTLAFPVAGTLMVEPTESESLEELERFIEAMIHIRAEMIEVAEGRVEAEQSVLRLAPHTAEVLTADEWDRLYSRSLAAYPVPRLRHSKYWVPVGRIDGTAGDRHFVCECPPMEAFDLEGPLAAEDA